MSWKTKKRCFVETGLTVRQQEARIQRGFWRRGIEYALIDGAQMVNVDAIERRNKVIAAGQVGTQAKPRKKTGSCPG